LNKLFVRDCLEKTPKPLLQLYRLLIGGKSSGVKVNSELKKIPYQNVFQHFPYMVVKILPMAATV
jgi:hypothetical protein